VRQIASIWNCKIVINLSACFLEGAKIILLIITLFTRFLLTQGNIHIAEYEYYFALYLN